MTLNQKNFHYIFENNPLNSDKKIRMLQNPLIFTTILLIISPILTEAFWLFPSSKFSIGPRVDVLRKMTSLCDSIASSDSLIGQRERANCYKSILDAFIEMLTA